MITDIEMPKINGVEVYRQIKKMNPLIKIIFTSGALTGRLEKQLRDEGVENFFRKPYEPADLLTRIREMIG